MYPLGAFCLFLSIYCLLPIKKKIKGWLVVVELLGDGGMAFCFSFCSSFVTPFGLLLYNSCML